MFNPARRGMGRTRRVKKEMEQEIGLVLLFPSPVSLSNPLHARTHTDTHTHAYTPSAQANSGERPGTFCNRASVCLCLYEGKGLEMWPA